MWGPRPGSVTTTSESVSALLPLIGTLTRSLGILGCSRRDAAVGLGRGSRVGPCSDLPLIRIWTRSSLMWVATLLVTCGHMLWGSALLVQAVAGLCCKPPWYPTWDKRILGHSASLVRASTIFIMRAAFQHFIQNQTKGYTEFLILCEGRPAWP
ncbi:hypothetical protein NDU88_000152 [Pleurodeles waltl]|uniref:Uncharacterized protein n=1 Tax=Pleurodeles waltl TaxID=8319 RepID=A0AAV7UP63_PLEWA|nr:hypothetical protein NDU88_000152 [Pleurodeles waltl]